MKLVPAPAYLEAMRRQGLSWRDLFGELIDNSFDARASRVGIELVPKTRRVVIDDDGDGCDDVERMLTIGDHLRQPGTRLGRYGVGLKDVGVTLWGEMTIDTTTGRKRQHCCVDWKRLKGTTDWDSADPVEMERDREHGTRIEFRRIDRDVPRSVEKLAADLGFVFAPALREGKQIVIDKGKKRVVCKPYQLPLLEDIVEEQFEVDGKWVRLRVGIVKDGEKNEKPGFIFYHEHRAIQNSALGSGDSSVSYSVSRIAGEVELGPKWILSKNKTGIVEGQDELGAAIFARCRVIFEKAKLRTRELKLDGLSKEVQYMLDGMLKKGKEKRGDGESNGTAKPRGTKRKRKKAKDIQAGDKVLEQMGGGGVKIDFGNMGGGRLGRAELDPPGVMLDRDNGYVARIVDEENTDATAMTAMVLLMHEAFRAENEGRLPFPGCREHNTALEALGTLMPKLVDARQKPAKKAREET